jgi:DNA-binding beta-propeller fold protein YncE
MRFLSGIWLAALTCSPAFTAEKLVLVAGTEQAPLKEPFGLDFTSDGKIVIAEYGAHRITQIDPDGKLTIRAGTATKGDVDGPALKAQFNGPHNLVVAKNGDIYVADTLNHKVKKIDGKTGDVSTIAGTGKKGFSGDGGPATQAEFDQTYHVVLDTAGTSLYVVDLGNRRIRAIDLKTGTVSTVVGNGKRGVPENGAKASEAPLVDPRACAFDSKSRLYILERSGNALRVVEGGNIQTVAGTGKQGNTGDGGPALKATLNGPKILWVDKNDDVIIGDAENNLVRKYVVKDGTIVRLAGTGKKGATKLGAPLETELNRPHGVGISPDGTLYIVDSENNRVLKVAKE